MNKIQNIQALKGMAVLLVVIFHLVIIESKYGGAQSMLPEFFKFGSFGIDIFFVISGLVIVIATRGKFQNNLNALQFLYHRLTRIFPIYWLYTLIVLCVVLIDPSLVNSSHGNQADITASFFLLSSDKPLLLNVAWALVHLMFFYQVFFFILALVAEKHLPKIIILWGLVIIGLNLIVETNNPLIKLMIHPLTLEFIGGCLLAVFFYKFKTLQLGTTSLLLLASIGLINAVFGYMLYLNITGTNELTGWWQILVFGVPAMVIVACIIFAERNGVLFPKFLTKVGDASYSIFLSHVLTLTVAGRVWQGFSSSSVYDNLLMIPVLFLLVVIVGFASYRYVEKPLLVMSRRVTSSS